jgi:dTDP-4-amino-4,6-dideoxygalactose transaminase
MSFKMVSDFEKEIASFFGSPYAVAVDCCTHAVELCLRHVQADSITVPHRTYISIPLLSRKLGIPLFWRDEKWEDYYYIGDTNIIDAAVLWEKDGYIPGTYMCISFQFKKHLSLGRGGVILLDDKTACEELRKMSYDGRTRDEPWGEQNIETMGYHYYMTPETAILGLEKLPAAMVTPPRKWTVTDWPDLRDMGVFK